MKHDNFIRMFMLLFSYHDQVAIYLIRFIFAVAHFIAAEIHRHAGAIVASKLSRRALKKGLLRHRYLQWVKNYSLHPFTVVKVERFAHYPIGKLGLRLNVAANL